MFHGNVYTSQASKLFDPIEVEISIEPKQLARNSNILILILGIA